jgi:hypothetical protein
VEIREGTKRGAGSMWEKRNACRMLVDKPGGSRPLQDLRNKWEVNRTMNGRGRAWTGLF